MGPWRAGPDSGERSRASAMLHSDALYSALTHAMSQLGLLEPWIEATAANPQGSAVRFSSCFPFSDQLLFVLPPKPFWPPPASLRVRWKSARYVPTSMVSLLLNGRSIREDDWAVDGSSECLLPMFRGQAVPSPYRPALRSAAAVDRLAGGVEPHRTACVEFHRNAGVWMAFDFADHAARLCWAPALQGALRLLADTGLGGERSRGWGRFEQPEFIEGSLPKLLFGKHAQAVPQTSNAYWLLSLFSPAESDTVDWRQGSYGVAMRGGRVESGAGWGAAKKSSRVIAEGSVLIAASPLTGMARDVAPDGFAHPVYRAGFALALPVTAKKPEPVVVEESEGPERGESADESPAEVAGLLESPAEVEADAPAGDANPNVVAGLLEAPEADAASAPEAPDDSNPQVVAGLIESPTADSHPDLEAPADAPDPQVVAGLLENSEAEAGPDDDSKRIAAGELSEPAAAAEGAVEPHEIQKEEESAE